MTVKRHIEYIRDGRSPVPKKEAVSRVMSANKGKHTNPELMLRKELRDIGLKDFKLHANLPGRPDVVFRKEKLAIFVNGCFWHRCPYCKRPLPKTHRYFWRKKFEANKARDKKNLLLLGHEGWRAVVVWECQLKKDATRSALRVKKKLAV